MSPILNTITAVIGSLKTIRAKIATKTDTKLYTILDVLVGPILRILMLYNRYPNPDAHRPIYRTDPNDSMEMSKTEFPRFSTPARPIINMTPKTPDLSPPPSVILS
jgi:hypothetical protein